MTKHSLPRFAPATCRRLLLTALGLASLTALLHFPTVGPAPARAASGEEASPAISPSTLAARRQQRQKHVAQLGADRWHAAGFRGQGVKIAILDTGFRGYRDHLGKALPANVTVRSFRSDGNLEAKDSQHGILCGETIHALAPDAELLFANWELERVDEFLGAVRWAREQGCRIISCSVVTPNWSDGEGGGAVHQELAQILGPGDQPHSLVCFASAGNTSDRHWTGPFHDGGHGFHAWLPGKLDAELTPWGSERVSVELYERPGADYDLFVYDEATGQAVGHAVTSHNQGDRNSAVVRFPPQDGHTYRVRVRLAHGPAGAFHLTSMFASIDCGTPKSGVCFPADGPAVIAMGAVDGEQHRLWYSACGPNSPRPKPDFVATIPFPSLWRERPFSGTSAAAPQGSGLAALWLCRHPDWTPDRVRAELRTDAFDLGPRGHDWETGYGLLHLPHE